MTILSAVSQSVASRLGLILVIPFVPLFVLADFIFNSACKPTLDSLSPDMVDAAASHERHLWRDWIDSWCYSWKCSSFSAYRRTQ